MFKRKEINLEEVRIKLINLLTNTLAEYRKHPNPQKTDTIMHYVSLIDPNSYLPQAFEIYTRDVGKYVYKNVTSGAPKILIGEELLKPMSPELVDLYILTLWGLNDRFTGTPALGNVFLLAATNYHNKRAVPLIQSRNWAEAEVELQDALEFANQMEQFLDYKLETLYLLGLCLSELGREDEAKKSFVQALEVNKQLSKEEAQEMQTTTTDIKRRLGTD